ILASCWGLIATFLSYKALRVNKLKVPAQYSSQQCAKCGHIHSNNRISQSEFVCIVCKYTENADLNAARIIAKRGIEKVLEFAKSQSVSSESPPVGTRESARRGRVRPHNPTVSEAARNPATLADISANC
ncbi:MAG: transposase, partial [Blastocatellia bacterium]|nr:transposase [Blastocatellia bacterium]